MISYAPQVFKYIRHMDGISDQDIIQSIEPKNNRYQIFKTNKQAKHNSGGASGSFFFFTQDKRFIIKTLFKHEKIKLLELLPKMVRFINQNKDESIISRIYGIYEVKIPGVDSVHLILQRNCLQIDPQNKMFQVFDLKGSKFTR